MYEWINYHWNAIKGHCQYECPYCFVKSSARFKNYTQACFLDENELKTNLGKDRAIFIGSKTDMWGPWVPKEWIEEVLKRCATYPKNEYIFQSKNPGRFSEFKFSRPARTLLGTTIETDRYPKGFQTKAPSIEERVGAMMNVYPLRRFVTIEPILKFNLSNLLRIIGMIRPEFVTIGADSKNHGLEEPDADKVLKLIGGLNDMKVEIRQKSNLKRLLEG